MASTKQTAVLAVAAGLVLVLSGCTGSDEPAASPTPSRSATATGSPSPSSPSSGETEPADEPSSAAPVPTAGADAWTDQTAYDACVEAADAELETGYTWADRSSQTLVAADGGVSIDVTGIFTGGDVGVANVKFRCLLTGDRSSPQVTGEIVS
jgi:hypothetical protein